jgi:hypothetical protein
VTGGIAVWTGGTAIQPIDYVPSRVSDFDGFLAFAQYFPYGITVDGRGYLWVAGLDTTRLWVKAFKVEGVNALAMEDLPSQNSYDIPDPSGAPMLGPSDVAVTKNGEYAYVVDRYARCAFTFRKSSTAVTEQPALPSAFALEQNYPNPFNPTTVISFTMPASGYARLSVSDMLGRELRVLVDGVVEAGRHREMFNAAGLPSGTYFYTLRTAGVSQTRAMLLVR